MKKRHEVGQNPYENDPFFAPRSAFRQLSRWRNAEKICQLRRGLYCLASPFQKVNPHPFLVTNRLVQASYVSLQSALSYYGMIPEHVPVTTSVTTNRPGSWETALGIFDFRHVQVDFFRYSEDLDFALERAETKYDFRAYLRAIQDEFTKEGYKVGIKLTENKTVNAASIRFNHLLYEFGLSPHRDGVLAVKIEVDTHPSAGAGLATTIVRRHVTLRLQHHDRASLLAGKLHAVFQRRYVKGRDLYDLSPLVGTVG